MSFIDADTLWAWEDAWREKDETLHKNLKIDDLRQVFLSLGKDFSQSTCHHAIDHHLHLF
jgi:hypothetical protein